MNNNVRLINDDDVDAAANSLAAAFMDDPLQTYTFPDEHERKEKSPAHFKAFLKYGLKFGDVYTINENAGAAVWLRPNETDVTLEKAEEGGLSKLPEFLGEVAAGRFFSALEFLAPYHEKDVPEPHWYLMVVGVHPDFCGKGLGKALLEPVLKKAEANGEPVYLETAQQTNIHFYKKLGFSVMRELQDTISGLKMWTFKKDKT